MIEYSEDRAREAKRKKKAIVDDNGSETSDMMTENS